ncbi:Pyruvate dehydrogenase (acetyl-transferring) [Alkaliphilus metalliredigens QYMF]|uniref:Pyruvate dehydrogenase E1 component subunit alpha n=1 Tax=Alkaliphilus metalliredigens (strain QYMF) TaxID=293826 RepID=A6TMN9_ALKMQ|nr:pyruvate dehydrogenase (acetyl-transferring) E1 component subunit alpha [Alkaliphilus metalliredigens]ABR47457.1 Pyruvate dehydrogenase (acetyl-transferring) [Alkaliphilus metalliredigens QYMF]
MIFEGYHPLDKTMFQVMDEEGNIIKPEYMPDISKEQMMEMYQLMIQTREADLKALMYQRQGRMLTYAPNIGQEAAQVGSAFPLKKEDWMVPAFRELGAWLTRGAKLEMIYLYWYGNEFGSYMPEDLKILPVSVPIASHLNHAAGIAWASKLQGKDEVTITYFGDGATSQGDFHEAMNWAGVYQVPVVFLCQNNQFAISVPRGIQTSSETIAQKALAYGMPGILVDGNDIFAMYAAVKEAFDRARRGEGPTLIEAFTYRIGAHTTSDDPKRYRSDEEVEKWKKKDPIDRMKKYLMSQGILTEEENEKIIEKAGKIAEEAFKYVEASGDTVLEDIFKYHYKEMTPQLTEQLAEYKAYLMERGEA